MEKGQKQGVDVSSSLCVTVASVSIPAKSICSPGVRHLAIRSVSCQLPILLAILGRVGSDS